jgi:hypothetical protein
MAHGDQTQCSASSQFDQRVRSSQNLPSEGVTYLFDHGVINRCLGRPWLAAEHTLALVAYVVVLGSPLTHSCLIVFIGLSEKAILVRCIMRIASSGTR